MGSFLKPLLWKRKVPREQNVFPEVESCCVLTHRELLKTFGAHEAVPSLEQSFSILGVCPEHEGHRAEVLRGLRPQAAWAKPAAHRRNALCSRATCMGRGYVLHVTREPLTGRKSTETARESIMEKQDTLPSCIYLTDAFACPNY